MIIRIKIQGSGMGSWGKQVGSMTEESQVSGCYNITFICTPTRKQVKSSGLFQKPQWGYMKEHQWKNIWYNTAVNITYKCLQQKETNGNKNENKIVRISKTKNNEKPEERSLAKTKARVKNENRWVQQTHTHSLTYTDTRRLHIHSVGSPLNQMHWCPSNAHTKKATCFCRDTGGKSTRRFGCVA